MPNLNRTTIEGHLGRDPELRYTPNGTALCTFSVAIKERWKQNGEDKEKTVWIDVKAWKDTAELVSENFKKGSAIHVEGKLDVEEWEKDGQKRSKVVVVAASVSIPLYRKKEQAGQTRAIEPDPQPAAKTADQPAAEQDDVPF